MNRTTAFLLTSIFVVFGSSPAFAQPSATLNRYRPGESSRDDFHLSRPEVPRHLGVSFQLQLDFADDPLVYESVLGSDDSERLKIVDEQMTATLGFGVGLWDRLFVYAGLPVVLLLEGATPAETSAIGIAAPSGSGVSDVFLGGRVYLTEASHVLQVAVQGTLTLPTSDIADDPAYRGDENATFQPELLMELVAGGARLVLNAGVRIRESTESNLTNLSFSDELLYGVGLAVPLWTDPADERTEFDVLAQVYGDSTFETLDEREGNALEALGGFKFTHAGGLVAGLAMGPGLTRGFGTPDVRFVASLGYTTPDLPPTGDSDRDGIMDDVDGCDNEPEDADGFEDDDGCPDEDNDFDGILDATDQCPNEGETFNNMQDEDGCPDSVGDTDGDGLMDNADSCVNEPEDTDGFGDEDGCPDPDNDGDGVMDAADRCPEQAGPVENGGCPDADRDGDTVVDRLDNCPDEPGTPENHGCREVQQVRIEGDRLQILDKVYFQLNRAEIQRRSHPLLQNVARVLNAHPEIGMVMVEGHTDSRGRRERNLELSQQRAEAVVRFLVEQGQVDANRLMARGYGPDRPIIQNATSDADHAENRRVEFRIVPAGEGAAPAQPDPAAQPAQPAQPAPQGGAGE